MAWQIVNIPLPDGDAIRGRAPEYRDLVLEVIQDGYEPFATAAFEGGIVMSFRRFIEDALPTFDPKDLPGQYL